MATYVLMALIVGAIGLLAAIGAWAGLGKAAIVAGMFVAGLALVAMMDRLGI